MGPLLTIFSFFQRGYLQLKSVSDPLKVDYSNNLPVEIIFEIIRHCYSGGNRENCDRQIYHDRLYVLRFRLLNRQWNHAVILWMNDQLVDVHLTLRKPQKTLFNWSKDAFLSTWKRQIYVSARRSVKFTIFAIFEVFWLEAENLTERETRELIQYCELPNLKSLQLKLNTRVIHVSNKLFSRLLSVKLSKRLQKLTWNVRMMTDDQFAILKEFCGRANIQALDLRINRNQISQCFDLATRLVSRNTTSAQIYRLPDSNEEHIIEFTQAELEQFIVLLNSLSKAKTDSYKIYFDEQILRHRDLLSMCEILGFSKLVFENCYVKVFEGRRRQAKIETNCIHIEQLRDEHDKLTDAFTDCDILLNV